MAGRNAPYLGPVFDSEILYMLRELLDQKQRLIRLLYFKTPHDDLPEKDKLTQIASRRVRWTGTRSGQRAFHRWVLVSALLTVPVLAMLLTLAAFGSLQPQGLGVILAGMAVASILLEVLLDGFYVYFGVQSVSELRGTQMLDLLRLSYVDVCQASLGRLRLAEFYNWRLCYGLLALRMALLGWWVVWLVGLFLPMVTVNPVFSVLTRCSYVGASLGLTLALGVALLREPYWRYRAVTIMAVEEALKPGGKLSQWSRLGVRMLILWGRNLFWLLGWYITGILTWLLVGLSVDFAAVLALSRIPGLLSVGVFVFSGVAGMLPLVYLLALRRTFLQLSDQDRVRTVGRQFLATPD